jgi:hypothetical protein
MHQRSQRGQRSPRDHGEGNHPARTPTFHQQCAGNLQGHIANKKDTDAKTKHPVAESQVVSHAERGISQTGAIKIVGDVKDEKK